MFSIFSIEERTMLDKISETRAIPVIIKMINTAFILVWINIPPKIDPIKRDGRI